MNGFSFRRFLAVLRKEWIQVRRDPFTLRAIIALPVMQLFLFGYAINANPRHLPTGLLSGNCRPRRKRSAALPTANCCLW
jgi:ABC-2 type transport system permease protein